MFEHKLPVKLNALGGVGWCKQALTPLDMWTIDNGQWEKTTYNYNGREHTKYIGEVCNG